MTHPHPLDRPVRSALTSGWAALARGQGGAWQLDPDYGPFAAPADFSTQAVDALAALSPGPDGLWCLEPREMPAPAGMAVVKTAPGVQMVAAALTPGNDAPFETLGDADAPEMLELALLTRPGPFARHTNRLGGFIGIRIDGRLAAMAGERMRMDGFTEVSGVCTHPDFRGRGYAPALMRVVTRRILDRGETAFLHAYADNAVAIALYESLGFHWRQTVTLTILGKRESIS